MPRWHSWLRHCATNQWVASSSPDGVKWILGVDSASNRNEYQAYFLGGKTRPVRKADNLTTFMCRLSRNLGASTSWNPLGLSRPVMGLLYLSTKPVMTFASPSTFRCSKSCDLLFHSTQSITPLVSLGARPIRAKHLFLPHKICYV
jgi:hypothetical protein